MVFRTNITNPFNKTNRKYIEGEIDLFGLYCIENNYIGLLFMDEYTCKDTVIRLNKPKNNQINRAKMSERYSFDNQIKRIYEI